MIPVLVILALAAVAVVLWREHRLAVRRHRDRARFDEYLDSFNRRPAELPLPAQADSCSHGRHLP
ncbi:MAG TPA: hypothetical protein VG275_07155 [Solirubrobacteraceae bacterium]|jgi:hypothetical protein|nr:hypothetical protein [Solirubrobacteraceae bacterium]